MITSIGITASRHGLSELQRRALTTFLHRARCAGATYFHHGRGLGCEIGAQIAHNLGYEVVETPPWKVIQEVQTLIALPPTETNTSNTWCDITTARRAGRPRLVVLPNGSVADRVGVDDLHKVSRGEYAAAITDQRISDEGAHRHT